MKKIVLILVLLLFSICIVHGKVQDAFIEKVDLKLTEGEVGILFLPTQDSTYLLIRTIHNSILLHTSGPDQGVENILKKLGQKQIDYSINTYVKAKNIVDIKNDIFEIDNIMIEKREDNYLLSLENQSLLVYNKGNFIPSSYVYFLNSTSLEETDIKLAFYKEDIGESFEKELTNHWIDSYKIKANEFTIVKFSDQSYNVIRIPDYYF